MTDSPSSPKTLDTTGVIPAAKTLGAPMSEIKKPVIFTPPPKVAQPNLTPSGSKPITVKGLPPFKMERASTATSRWLKLLAYGVPGAGKTTLLGTSADVEQMRDILYVDCEKGQLAIEDNDRIKYPQFVSDNRISASNFKTVAQVHDFLVAHIKWRDTDNIEELRKLEAWLRGCTPEEIETPKKFFSVMIDSLSEVDIYCNYSILGITQDKVLQDAGGGDIDVAGWPEFRKVSQSMQMLMRAFRDLPIHLLCSAGRVFAEDELKKRYYSPAFTGQLRTQIPSFFDIVGYMAMAKVGDNLERRLYVKPIDRFEAKNRRPIFKEDFFKDPTMTDIMKGVGLMK